MTHTYRMGDRYVPGIFWGGVGNNYSFNTVHNGPHNCESLPPTHAWMIAKVSLQVYRFR